MRFRTLKFAVVVAASATAGCTPATDQPNAGIDAPGVAAIEAAATIDAEKLRETVAVLASDEFEGRGPASSGDIMTQRYLSTALEELGYTPAGVAGSWLQPFDIVSVTTTTPESWSFTGNGNTLVLRQWDEFIASSGVQEPSAEVRDAEVVFVGYGLQAPEYDWDDYKGLDVSGKLLLMLNNDPDWDPDLFEGNRRLYYGRWTYKYEIAAQLGAAGAIIIHTTPSAGYPFQVVQTSWSGPQYALPAQNDPTTTVQSWITEEAARRLVSFAGLDLAELVESARSRDFVPVRLGVTTSLSLQNELSRVQTANVAGLLEGSDPELRDEVVVFTAHHDHLGIGEPNAAGDAIYNGARDNAVGVAQVLAVADAFRSLPVRPRRSILMLFVAAEEQGLLGSAFYAQQPTFEPGRIAANINIDGGNIWGLTRDISFIGFGKSSLDAVVERIANFQARTVQGDQFPDRGYFYRSDQFNFAKIGVPAVYLGEGTDFIGQPEGWGVEQIDAWVAVHYHQPSDELEDDWDFSGMIEDAQLAYLIGLQIADADEMPSWNPGDEFEAARLESLADR
ncbi:MAG: M28 family peptidase [Gammaproteobacteria bacterium]